MSTLADEDVARNWLDYALIAAAAVVVAAFLGLGFYGSAMGFLQTTAYFKANDIVSACCAMIAAGCGAYLLVELLPGRGGGRAVIGVLVICGMFGYFAVSKGVPAAVTTAYGAPARLVFKVESFDWGGKGCPSTVVARRDGFEDFRMCIDGFDKRQPRIGSDIEIRGKVSNWGLTRESLKVLN